MQLLITRKEVAALAVLASALCVLAWLTVDGRQLPLALLTVVCAVIVAFFVAELYRRQLAQHAELLAEFQHAQALAALFQLIQPRAPLPLYRTWTAAPDLALLLVGKALAAKPRTIVELGSGSSTVAFSYVLEKLGGGRIISLEHDAPSKAKTEQALRDHGLEQYATVVLAPLRPVQVGGMTVDFYDLAGLEGVEQIDFVFVDGPPSFMQPLARYPALPLLWSRLVPGGTLVLDDARRSREQEVARRWKAEFPNAELELAETQRGALIVRKPR
jgi:predicted O-methyltransferase YrrM